MNILTHNELHKLAPAIFATAPDNAVSDRYGFYPRLKWSMRFKLKAGFR